MSATIHPYTYGQDGEIVLSTDSLTICTQIKEMSNEVLSYHDLFEDLTVADYVTSISPLPVQRKCPSPPRPVSVPMFCWSHVVGH